MNVQDLAAKLLELSRRGEPGEAMLAQQKLGAVLKKYNLKIEDLDEEVKEIHWFRYSFNWEYQLLIQLAYKITNYTGTWVHFGNGERRRVRLKEVGVKCTQAQFIEFEYLYSFYHELFKREFDVFLSAFIQKHRIFGTSEQQEDADVPDAEYLEKLTSMMNALGDQSPLKAIEG